MKINLQYDIHQGLLNIFVKNIGDNHPLPCHINVLSASNHSSQPICYEVSTTYSYDLSDEDEIDLHDTMLVSSSCSYSDVQTLDNDDGYSTHSHDDTDPSLPIAIQQQQLSLMIPPVKSLRLSSEQYVLTVRRLMKQLTWLNPFKKTIEQMMIHEIFA